MLRNDEVSNEKVKIIQQEEEEEMVQLAYEAKVGLLQNKAAKGTLDYLLVHLFTCLRTHSLTLTHPLIHPFIHSLTHSLTYYLLTFLLIFVRSIE